VILSLDFTKRNVFSHDVSIVDLSKLKRFL